MAPRIFRMSRSTLVLCVDCLKELGPAPGRWDEDPLQECSVCGECDFDAQEEMNNISDALQQHWEEDQPDPMENQQEYK
jgi:hypothetical protein